MANPWAANIDIFYKQTFPICKLDPNCLLNICQANLKYSFAELRLSDAAVSWTLSLFLITFKTRVESCDRLDLIR